MTDPEYTTADEVVREALAASEADLLADVRQLRVLLAEAHEDCDTYQELTRRALDLCHQLMAERSSLTKRLEQLRDDVRALRAGQ